MDDNPLMDKKAVASFIGGISPRVAANLMRKMPCINVGNGDQRPRLRVYQHDLEKWLENRKEVRTVGRRVLPGLKQSAKKKNAVSYGEGFDENGHILRRRKAER